MNRPTIISAALTVAALCATYGAFWAIFTAAHALGLYAGAPA